MIELSFKIRCCDSTLSYRLRISLTPRLGLFDETKNLKAEHECEIFSRNNIQRDALRRHSLL